MSKVNNYALMLSKLLPKGHIWKVENNSTMENFLLSHAEELARLDGENFRFISEMNPLTSLEALEDWERVLGLPDECLGAEQTIELRRKMVIRKLQRGQAFSREYLLQLAFDLGYPQAEIEEYNLFQANVSRAGDRLNNAHDGITEYFAWHFVALLKLGASQVREFRAGESQANDRLRTWGDEVIECIVNRDRPAHLKILFAYEANT